jgi:hypothetical protein
MQKLTLAALAAIGVMTLSVVALAPTFTTTAEAKQTTEACFHNGNGEPIPCEDRRGNNANQVTLCKERGKFVPCPEE